MRTITTDAGVIAYDVRGNGEAALLFNHSSTSSLAWSELFLETLAAKLTVVTVDYRGTGCSSLGSTPFSLLDLAGDGCAVLREERIEQAMVIGTSLGGAVAQEFALAFPEQVTVLVLMGTFGGPSNFVPPDAAVLKLVEEFLPRWTERGKIEWWRRLLPTLYGAAFLKEHEDLALELELKGSRFTTIETIARHGAAAAAFELHERLPSIPAPTLIIHGAEDPIVPAKNGEILASRIPNSEYIELKDVGHLPAVERPLEVADCVLRFAHQNGVKLRP